MPEPVTLILGGLALYTLFKGPSAAAVPGVTAVPPGTALTTEGVRQVLTSTLSQARAAGSTTPHVVALQNASQAQASQGDVATLKMLSYIKTALKELYNLATGATEEKARIVYDWLTGASNEQVVEAVDLNGQLTSSAPDILRDVPMPDGGDAFSALMNSPLNPTTEIAPDALPSFADAISAENLVGASPDAIAAAASAQEAATSASEAPASLSEAAGISDVAGGVAVVGAAFDIAMTIAGNAPDWEKAVISALDVATVYLAFTFPPAAIVTGVIRLLVGLFGGGGPSHDWLTFGARVGETITLEIAAAQQLVRDLARTMFEDEVAAVVAKFNATMATRIGHDSPAWADVHGPYDLVHLVGAGGSAHEGGITYNPDPINEQLKKAVPFALQRVQDARNGVPGAVGQLAAIWQQRYRVVSTPEFGFQTAPLAQLQGPIGLVALSGAEPWWRVTPRQTDARPDPRMVREMPVLAELLWQLFYSQIAQLFGFPGWAEFMDWDLGAEWTAYRHQRRGAAPPTSFVAAPADMFAQSLGYLNFQALREAAFSGRIGAITKEGTMIDLTALYAALQDLRVAVSALQGRAGADEAAITNALTRIGFVESYAVSQAGPAPGSPFYQAAVTGGS